MASAAVRSSACSSHDAVSSAVASGACAESFAYIRTAYWAMTVSRELTGGMDVASSSILWPTLPTMAIRTGDTQPAHRCEGLLVTIDDNELYLKINGFARDTGWLHAPATAYAEYGLVVF